MDDVYKLTSENGLNFQKVAERALKIFEHISKAFEKICVSISELSLDYYFVILLFW